jgi:hypothetical protein
MASACREHGSYPRELAAIGRRLVADEDAREEFEVLVGIEVIRRKAAL